MHAADVHPVFVSLVKLSELTVIARIKPTSHYLRFCLLYYCEMFFNSCVKQKFNCVLQARYFEQMAEIWGGKYVLMKQRATPDYKI